MIATLAEIVAADGDRVGGKALNCAELRRAGFPVPDGLVVVARVATVASVAAAVDDDRAAADREDELGIAPADATRLIAHPWFAAFPDEQRFAVRSSAVGEDSAGHSFAGVHDTVLDVERSRILAAVRTCMQSTRSAQARAYRASRGLAAPASTGVLIQPMVAARASGVVFTVNPVTGADELLVETVAGLGDDLVSGRVQPDRYRLAKPDGAVLERDGPASADAALAVLPVLVDLARRVERFYGAPQDIEWAADDQGVWLLQSRPITTAAAPPPAALELPPTSRVDVEWTRANLAEVMPDQTSPQALAAYVALLNAAQRMFAGGLLAAEDEYGPPFAAIGGRMYFNLTQVIRISQIGGIPPAAAKRSIGHSEGITPADAVQSQVPLATFLKALPDFLRLAWLDLRSAALVRRMDADNVTATARLAVADPGSLDDAAILERLSEWAVNGPRQMLVVLVHTGVLRHEEQLRKICRAVGEDYEAFVYPQLAVGEPSVSTQQAFDLVELAEIARSEPPVVSALSLPSVATANFRERLAGTRFLAAFDRFLARYGHRGLYESDSALPRYREDPSPLFFAIQAHLNNPPAESPSRIRQRLQEEAAAAWARFDAKLSWFQRLTIKPRVKALVARIKGRYLRREYCRSELVKVLEHARRLQLVLAARFVERGWIEHRDDYFMLLPSEIDARVRGALEPAALRPIVARRRQRLAFERTLAMPLYLRQADIPAVLSGRSPDPGPPPLDDDDRLTGLCVSRGTVEAPVVVIRDPREFALMRRGAILVAPATDPSWTPLFTLAAGVIVEVGGVLSHASTVAREYGLPALANVNRATTRLRTGDRVRLDASAGVAMRCRDGGPRDPR